MELPADSPYAVRRNRRAASCVPVGNGLRQVYADIPDVVAGWAVMVSVDSDCDTAADTVVFRNGPVLVFVEERKLPWVFPDKTELLVSRLLLLLLLVARLLWV